MSVEAIVKVKEAEDFARNKLSLAKDDVEKILGAANVTAKEKANKILENAYEKRSEILEKAKEEGNLSAEPIIKKSKEDAEKISKISDENLSEIVNLVIKRVVIDNGNS